MSVFYVRSTDGDNGDNGTTWALAKATLAGAFAVASAGDTIYVSQAHAETQGSAMTLTSPGTAAAPCRVLCGNDGAEPPTALAATATIETTGTYGISCIGCAYYYGIHFKVATGGGTANFVTGSAVTMLFVADTCIIELANTSGIGGWGFNSTSAKNSLSLLKNTTLKAHVANTRINPHGRFSWEGGTLDTSTVVPTQLFYIGSGVDAFATVKGVNLSGLTTALCCAAASGSGSSIQLHFQNCKLNAGVSALTAAAIAGWGAEHIFIENCDSGDTNTRLDTRTYAGSVLSETTIKRTSGASDGTTGFCWKMTALATPEFFAPLESPPIAVWNDATGSKTLTVEILHDSVTALKDDDIWVEVEYLGTSGYPQSLFASDRKTDILAAGANQTTSAASWTTTGLTNPMTQKLVATFVPTKKGPVIAKVMLAKQTYTVYVCPLVSIA